MMAASLSDIWGGQRGVALAQGIQDGGMDHTCPNTHLLSQSLYR